MDFGNCSSEWGDFDGDGDLDILFSGRSKTGDHSYSVRAEIYKNDGNNIFNIADELKMTGIYDGSVAVGDYNNDGRLDVQHTSTFLVSNI